MGELIRAYWSFLPYFALLTFLTLMSVREGRVRKARSSGEAN